MATLKIELETPRSHAFTDDELSPWRAEWYAWPVADEPAPFDRDAAIEEARTNRHASWFWAFHADRVGAQRDGHMTRAEQAFWASLMIHPDFAADTIPREHLHPDERGHPLAIWVEACSAYVDEGTDAGAFLDLCGPLLARLQTMSSVSDDVYKTLGRALRWFVPWTRAFEFARAELDDMPFFHALEGLGPAPEADRERASALTREVVEATDMTSLSSYDLTYGVAHLLLAVPLQDLIPRYFEAWEAVRGKKEAIEYVPAHGLVFHVQDLKTFTRLYTRYDFTITDSDIPKIFGRFGYDGVDVLMRRGMRPRKDTPYTSTVERALGIAAPEVIEHLQPLHAKGGARAEVIEAHLESAPLDHVAHGLIACCNRAGKKRTWAVERMRALLARDGGRAALEAALTQWKTATADFVRAEVLDHDEEVVVELPRSALPAWADELIAKSEGFTPPGWWPEEPPHLRIAAGALPEACALGLAARVATEVEAVSARDLEGLEAESAGALAAAVLDAWHEAEEVAAAWPLRLAAAFPTDASVATMERYVREKRAPSRTFSGYEHKRVAVKELGKADLASARRSTLWIRHHHPKSDLCVAAKEAIEAYCAEHDVSEEEYADRAVSSFGLDARSGRDFDYGARTVRMRVSGREVSFLDTTSEKVTTRLPKGTRKDDTDKVERARQEYEVIGKPLREELDAQRVRFEHGMLTGRRWRASVWREDVLGHPLLGAIARGLVWELFEGERRVGYARPDEEGGLIDVDFEDVTLTEEMRLGLPHPMDMGSEDFDAWQEHLLGFEIIQPFDQLGRAIHRADEATLDFLAALEAREVELDIKALEARAASGLARLEWGGSAPRIGWSWPLHMTPAAPPTGEDEPTLYIEFPRNMGFTSSRRHYDVTTTPFVGMQYGARRTMPRGDEDPGTALGYDELPAKAFSEAVVILRGCVSIQE